MTDAKRVVVTGATGMIGRALCKRLIASGYQVVAFSRDPQKARRSVPGAAEYLGDLVNIFERHGWHWAFYQFRADSTWTERDFEYGTRPPGAGYWEAVGRGEHPQLTRVEDNPVWNVLKAALRR